VRGIARVHYLRSKARDQGRRNTREEVLLGISERRAREAGLPFSCRRAMSYHCTRGRAIVRVVFQKELRPKNKHTCTASNDNCFCASKEAFRNDAHRHSGAPWRTHVSILLRRLGCGKPMVLNKANERMLNVIASSRQRRTHDKPGASKLTLDVFACAQRGKKCD
jgi:hypothetical protein